jgi:signal transduction histidine kinase
VAKEIVEAHGGKIWAESKPGEGSTFHLTLPTAKEENQGEETAAK